MTRRSIFGDTERLQRLSSIRKLDKIKLILRYRSIGI